MYRFRSKPECLSQKLYVCDGQYMTLDSYEMCQFTVHYEAVMFYSTGHRVRLSQVNYGNLKGSKTASWWNYLAMYRTLRHFVTAPFSQTKNIFYERASFLGWRARPGDSDQGILRGEVSLYGWPPDWLVWNQLYDNWQFLFLFAKQTNPFQTIQTGGQWYSDTSPFSIPCSDGHKVR